MTETINIEGGVAYVRTGPNGGRYTRFVLAIGDDVAPDDHPLHGTACVKFRPMGEDRFYAANVAALDDFKRWCAPAIVDIEATDKARDLLGFPPQGALCG